MRLINPTSLLQGEFLQHGGHLIEKGRDIRVEDNSTQVNNPQSMTIPEVDALFLQLLFAYVAMLSIIS